MREIMNKRVKKTQHKKPQQLYNLIKQKRDNAKLDLEINHAKITLKEYHGLFGQIAAYNDVLSLMESMGLDK